MSDEIRVISAANLPANGKPQYSQSGNDAVMIPNYGTINMQITQQTASMPYFGGNMGSSSHLNRRKCLKGRAEPFAFKVQDTELFFRKIEECHKYDLEGRFHREAVSWELWQVIKGGPLDVIDYTNYVAINDYTCDIDDDVEALMFERRVFGV